MRSGPPLRFNGGGRRVGAEANNQETAMATYGDKAQEKVKTAMHERKKGTLKSGGSGKKVTNPKQAIAIGLSEARKEGGKVPPPKKSAAKKSPAKKATAKKTAAKKAPAKKTAAKKASAKKAASKKTAARRTAAKKTPAKKSATRKTPTKRTAARKAPAKKSG
jgi:hypothetical protein